MLTLLKEYWFHKMIRRECLIISWGNNKKKKNLHANTTDLHYIRPFLRIKASMSILGLPSFTAKSIFFRQFVTASVNPFRNLMQTTLSFNKHFNSDVGSVFSKADICMKCIVCVSWVIAMTLTHTLNDNHSNNSSLGFDPKLLFSDANLHVTVYVDVNNCQEICFKEQRKLIIEGMGNVFENKHGSVRNPDPGRNPEDPVCI